MPDPTLSIIVPLAAGQRPDAGLTRALGELPSECQLIVSLAGDHEAEAWPDGTEFVHGPAGRGRQLNRGAERARGAWLWFLHGDSRIEPHGVERALAFIRAREQAIGYGRLRFLADGPALVRLNALGANLRSHLFGLPYGDQGLCIPARQFRALAGFREDLARGEDLDFVVRARRSGLKTRPMGLTIATSAKRYRQQGWLATSLKHQIAACRLIRNARRAGRGDRA